MTKHGVGIPLVARGDGWGVELCLARFEDRARSHSSCNTTRVRVHLGGSFMMKDVHELAIQLLWSPGWQLSVAPARVNIFRTWLGAAKTFFLRNIVLELLPHYKRFIRTIYILRTFKLILKTTTFEILNLFWFGHKRYLECPLPNHVCPLCEIIYQFTRSIISKPTVLKGRVVTPRVERHQLVVSGSITD